MAIQQFIHGKFEELYKSFHQISTLQWANFQEMIPETEKNLWQRGLNSDLFKIKICGAGGGGFLMGMTRDWDQFEQMMQLSTDQEKFIAFF